MTTRNCRIRFMDNNYAMKPTITTSYSSQLSSTYAFSNSLDEFRSKVWRTAGFFEITSSNNKLYINDGSNKTATITAQNYT